jgi:serine phosphatase RsbU (regulator of sigma subunit)
MRLAAEASEMHIGLQATLVPPVLYSGKFVEACGRSVPLEQVGGDLVNLVAHGPDVVAYVIDASGHGLRAGVLMSMAKTAFRYGLLLSQPLERLVRDLNSVLSSLKERHMFLTLAALRFNGTNEVEHISAGHLPLLHYQQRTGSVVRHGFSQFPLGMFAEVEYVSQRLKYEAGDVFALVTDGVVETGDELDAYSGLNRLSIAMRNTSGGALPDMMTALLAPAVEHGAQRDDATVLLLRCGDYPGQCEQVRTPEVTWLKFLDELSQVLAAE